jgi:hypothetical protein
MVGEAIVGLAGSGDGFTVNTNAGEVLQALVATTVIVPTPDPAVKLIVSAVLVPLQPVPDTVHV